MADQIQIPQRQIPNMQFQGAPTDLIQALYNRPKPGEIAANSLSQGINGLLDQYYKRKQLQAQAFQAGGPFLMHQMGYLSDDDYNNLLNSMGSQTGTQPQPSSGQMTSPPSASGTPGGMTPGNYGNSPQTSAYTLNPNNNQGGSPGQSMTPASGTTQAPITGTVGTGGVGDESPNSNGAPMMSMGAPGASSNQSQPQGNQPVMNSQSGLPQTMHDTAAAITGSQDPNDHIQHFTQMGMQVGNPNQGQHAQNIQNIQSQMSKNVSMYGPEFGGKMNQGLQDQLNAEKALMEGEQFNVGQKNENTRFNIAQNAEQNRFNVSQQNAKNKAGAEEISKQGPQTTEVKTLQGMFSNLDDNLKSYFQGGKNYPGSGNLYKLTKGRAGSDTGANIINQGQPLVASINKALTARFNMGEADLLSNALAPSPNDTPKYAANKMKMLHQIINAMDQGNKDNVKNVISAINGNVSSQVGGQ